MIELVCLILATAVVGALTIAPSAPPPRVNDSPRIHSSKWITEPMPRQHWPRQD